MTKEERYERDMKLLDEIQEIRARNNVPWMNIMRLAFRVAPEGARKLMAEITDMDNQITRLTEQLVSKEGD